MRYTKNLKLLDDKLIIFLQSNKQVKKRKEKKKFLSS